ncbi:hypothetical protein PDJAM_G00084070, partial [Pangasius djambal]|nr:hypothetical protein [Pangasius djambal]
EAARPLLSPWLHQECARKTSTGSTDTRFPSSPAKLSISFYSLCFPVFISVSQGNSGENRSTNRHHDIVCTLDPLSLFSLEAVCCPCVVVILGHGVSLCHRF